LIAGASQGKGLGDTFLRHIERTAVLLHLIDSYQNNVADSYKTIQAELDGYSKSLGAKPQVVALTKIEGLDQEIVDDLLKQLKKVVAKKTPLFTMSGSAGVGLKPLLKELSDQGKLQRAHDAQQAESAAKDLPGVPVYGFDQPAPW